MSFPAGPFFQRGRYVRMFFLEKLKHRYMRNMEELCKKHTIDGQNPASSGGVWKFGLIPVNKHFGTTPGGAAFCRWTVSYLYRYMFRRNCSYFMELWWVCVKSCVVTPAIIFLHGKRTWMKSRILLRCVVSALRWMNFMVFHCQSSRCLWAKKKRLDTFDYYWLVSRDPYNGLFW